MPELSQVNELLYTIQPILWAIAIIVVVLVLMWAIPKIADNFKKEKPESMQSGQ